MLSPGLGIFPTIGLGIFPMAAPSATVVESAGHPSVETPWHSHSDSQAEATGRLRSVRSRRSRMSVPGVTSPASDAGSRASHQGESVRRRRRRRGRGNCLASLWPCLVTPIVVRFRGEPLRLSPASPPVGTFVIYDLETLTPRGAGRVAPVAERRERPRAGREHRVGVFVSHGGSRAPSTTGCTIASTW